MGGYFIKTQALPFDISSEYLNPRGFRRLRSSIRSMRWAITSRAISPRASLLQNPTTRSFSRSLFLNTGVITWWGMASKFTASEYATLARLSSGSSGDSVPLRCSVRTFFQKAYKFLLSVTRRFVPISKRYGRMRSRGLNIP